MIIKIIINCIQVIWGLIKGFVIGLWENPIVLAIIVMSGIGSLAWKKFAK